MRERWNAEMRGPRGAAFAAWALISLQDAPVDMANYYTAEIQMFGLFNFNGVPQKAYYAFKAFRELLDTPRRVNTPPCVAGQVASCAGLSSDGSRAAVLLSSFYPTDDAGHLVLRGLPWSGPTQFEVQLVDAHRDFERTRRGVLEPSGLLALPELKEPAVVLLRLSPVSTGSEDPNPDSNR
jgi:hypothetical protein